MGYIHHRVTVQPEEEPLSLTDVKTHLRLIPNDDSEDDAILKPLIRAAREYCENITGRALPEQTIAAYPDAFVDMFYGRVRLPKPPIQAIEAVTVYWADGGSETLDPSAYFFDEVDGAIVFLENRGSLRGIRPIEIQYRAGYEAIPFSIRQAMLLMIGHWYENREAVEVGAIASTEVSLTARTILNQYRVWWF